MEESAEDLKMLRKKYEYLDIKEGDYVQTKEVIKGRVVGVIKTGNTDQWGMSLPLVEMVILDGKQRIVIDARELDKQK